MQRQLQAELLDTLPPSDPGAIGSRRDLRWLNFFMGHVGILTRILRKSFPHKPAHRILDLGGGDGDFLLKLCCALPGDWEGVEVILVDRHKALGPEMVDRFRMKGWTIHFAEADIFEYLRRRASPFVDVVIANLVLHHFSDEEIHELFSLIQTTTSLFVAVEPRRSPMALAFSRSVRLIGCNAVTRHDAPASVQAGFAANELTPLWPDRQRWLLEEGPAGLFSHLFASSKIQK